MAFLKRVAKSQPLAMPCGSPLRRVLNRNVASQRLKRGDRERRELALKIRVGAKDAKEPKRKTLIVGSDRQYRWNDRISELHVASLGHPSGVPSRRVTEPQRRKPAMGTGVTRSIDCG